jgi:hypothetical protein
MTVNYRVGGDIDAMCTKCKMLLGHTILAMVGPIPKRVRCNTCQGEHNYHSPSSKPVRRAASTGREKPSITSWEAQLAGKDLSRARKYAPRDRFEKDEVIDHPTFGIGIVLELRGDKLEVAFKAYKKTLVHGKVPATS